MTRTHLKIPFRLRYAIFDCGSRLRLNVFPIRFGVRRVASLQKSRISALKANFEMGSRHSRQLHFNDDRKHHGPPLGLIKEKLADFLAQIIFHMHPVDRMRSAHGDFLNDFSSDAPHLFEHLL